MQLNLYGAEAISACFHVLVNCNDAMQARQELREARGRVEALLVEKSALQGRLAALQEATADPGTRVSWLAL